MFCFVINFKFKTILIKTLNRYHNIQDNFYDSMRKIYLSFMFFFLSLITYGQNSRKPNNDVFRKYELGVNATSFLSNIFSLNNDTESIRYALTTRYFLNRNTGIRFSAGGDFNQTAQDFGSTTSEYAYNGRLGIEYGKPISNKFHFYFGLDIFGQSEFSESTTNIGFDDIKVSTRIRNLGLGPALRLEYHLTDRIVLMTEGFLYGSSYYRVRTESAGSVNRREENGLRVILSEPTNLFVSIKF
jgi:hypothetical protein